MLGYAVSEYFESKGYQIKKISRTEFDIAHDNHHKLYDILESDDVVINCAGVIKPRIKDMTVEDVLRVNSIFPHNLAKVCTRLNLKCFHITTDCVYTGKEGNYTETDLFDADDLYGLSKNGGDSADCMVLRTSIIGEENGQSRSLLEWAKSQKGNEVNGFTNHKWNGVTTLFLAEIIEKILTKDLYQKGVFHIHSPNTVTKYELLKIFNRVYDLQLKIKPVEAKEYCDRSLRSVKRLSNNLVNKTITEQLKEMREFFRCVVV